MRLLTIITAFALLLSSQFANAQSQFSPAIIVNDRAITSYEIDQREKLLTLFRTPGDIPKLAREQLIEDRLKQGELARAGLRLDEDSLTEEMEAFASRADMTLDQFSAILSQNGIETQTLADFVANGVTWRDYIRTRFGRNAQITEAEIDRALGRSNNSATGIQVLLSEIIIAAPPERAAQVMARAQQISQLTSTGAFSAAAREVSALPSRANGGRLGWLPISNYPQQIRTLLLGLSNGEVTAPLPIPNGVALFQMRGIREVAQAQADPTALEYAAFYVSADAGEAQRVADRVDTCDDLYGEAQGLPAERLERDTLPFSEIPQDVAIELARLDPGEVSTNLTRSNGETRVVLMLCSRQFTEGDTPDREAIRDQLRSQRLSGLAASLLADLRAAATIQQ
jgi:peptidyl-prolyl cis-trans isomerase SurA